MSQNMSKAVPKITDYYSLRPIQTRWMDNDIYGHVNNVVYYSYFDSIVNQYLIEDGDLDIQNGEQIGFIVGSQCHYHSSIAFPDKLTGALRVQRIGSSSVEYGVAIFREDEQQACAHGSMTHVFVDRESNKPTPITGTLREALEKAMIAI